MYKELYANLYEQMRVRGNLYTLRDRRFVSPLLDTSLKEAATVWPDVLPRKWKPRTVLDVGAFQGKVARQLAQLYPLDFIGLVEPQPELATRLNTLTFAPRQRVFPCALGRTEGTATLHILDSAASSSLLGVAPEAEGIFHRPMGLRQTIEVPMRTLDAVFDDCGLDELDLLKIDVQGYELEVLAAAERTLQNTRMVFVEVSFFEHYVGQPLFGEVYSFLTSAGFGMRATSGYLYDDRGRPLQCDAVFVNLEKL